MVQDLFPDPGHDGEEPDGFPLPPAVPRPARRPLVSRPP